MTAGYHCKPTRMAKLFSPIVPSIGADRELPELSSTVVGTKNAPTTLENSLIMMKLNMHLPFDLSVLFLGICPQGVKRSVHTKTCEANF